ncbi:MAG: prepilin peptidase [Deltaproteobacteria bacterium]|nr:prepilin peptidase [Deltaproteobacteria bacterium]
MPTVQIVLYAVLGLALVISAVTDIKSRLIYDVITLPTILLSLLIRLVHGGPINPLTNTWGLASGLAGLFIGFGVFFVMMLTGGMMAGDVKLMAAVGAALGIPGVVSALMFTALVGGLEAILVVVWKGSLVDTFVNMGRKLAHALRIKRMDGPPAEKTYVPYGVAIAVGSVWAMWWDWQHPLLDSVSH